MIDANTIKKCIEGDRTSQKVLYEYIKVNMFVLCQRYFSNVEDARDALQDGFIKLFRDLRQFDDSKGMFASWAKKVFINTCLEKLRKKKVDFHSLEEYNFESVYEPTIITDLQLKDLTKMIQLLPTGYRTVFNLYVIEGYNHQEIGEILGISNNTSKTQLMKAKNLLKMKFEEILK